MDYEYLQADAELFAMLAPKPIVKRDTMGYFVPREQMREIRRVTWYLDHKQELKRAVGYAVEGGIFLLAAVTGWMAVPLGLICASICAIRGGKYYWNARHK